MKKPGFSLLRLGLIGLPLTASLVVLGFFIVGLGRDTGVLPSPLEGKALPAIEAPSLFTEHAPLEHANYPQNWWALNVLASWCVPCQAEHPYITELARHVPVYGLVWKDSPENIRTWLARLGNPYRQLAVDESGRNGIEIGVYGVPETYLIDANGFVRYKHVGPIDGATLSMLLDMVEANPN